MSRTLGGSTVGYTWDVGAGLPGILQDSAGNSYVYGLDLISRTDGGGAQEYDLYDGLGSTTGLANGTGTVVGTYEYDVFGALRLEPEEQVIASAPAIISGLISTTYEGTAFVTIDASSGYGTVCSRSGETE